ncbi:hypothetical protein AB0A60_25435 [Streptomyces sp. NPDC046275]
MDAYRHELDEKIAAWVSEHLAASPSWGTDRLSEMQVILNEVVEEAA